MSKATHGLNVTRNTKDMQVVFNLVNKATETIEDKLAIDWSEVHEDCRDFVSLYGLTKILMDKQSGIDMMSKLEAFLELFDDTLRVGILNRDRKSGGPTVRPEVEALATLKKITVKQAQKLLGKYSKEQREDILTSHQVAAEVKRMAKKHSDEPSADLLDDLLKDDKE